MNRASLTSHLRMRKYFIQLKMADDDEEDYDTQIDYKKLRETHETVSFV